MSNKDFNHDNQSSELEAENSENLMMRPPDEDPFPPYEPPSGDHSSPIGWLDSANNSGYVTS